LQHNRRIKPFATHTFNHPSGAHHRSGLEFFEKDDLIQSGIGSDREDHFTLASAVPGYTRRSNQSVLTHLLPPDVFARHDDAMLRNQYGRRLCLDGLFMSLQTGAYILCQLGAVFRRRLDQLYHAKFMGLLQQRFDAFSRYTKWQNVKEMRMNNNLYIQKIALNGNMRLALTRDPGMIQDLIGPYFLFDEIFWVELPMALDSQVLWRDKNPTALASADIATRCVHQASFKQHSPDVSKLFTNIFHDFSLPFFIQLCYP
jgi:hypothetical protein